MTYVMIRDTSTKTLVREMRKRDVRLEGMATTELAACQTSQAANANAMQQVGDDTGDA